MDDIDENTCSAMIGVGETAWVLVGSVRLTSGVESSDDVSGRLSSTPPTPPLVSHLTGGV